MIYPIDEAKDLVIKAGKELLASGLIARTWGNISARISATQFVITPSGRPYDSLTPDDIVIVSVKDGSYMSDVKPSSEKGVHAAAYRMRPEAGFIIHTQQEYATALSTLGQTFRIRQDDETDRAILGPDIPTAKYGLSSTKKLAANVEEALKEHPDSKCVLMRNHGALCVGGTYEEVFKAADRLERACRQRYRRLASIHWPREASRGLPLGEYAEVLHREIHEEYDRRYQIFDSPSVGCLIETRAPFIVRMSLSGKPMQVYVDDLAQMAGMLIPCVRADASDKLIARLLRRGGAVLIQGKGAICAAGNEEDAEALMIVLNKGCQTALLAEAGCAVRPVGTAGGLLEHLVYKAKYSKLAEEPEEDTWDEEGDS